MFTDARTLPDGAAIDADVCIVGAGAAGVTLALELIDQPFRVCLVESGGLKPHRPTQALARGESTGLAYFPLHETRQHVFGGTTNRWAGRCAPFEPSDFQRRDWVPHSGWPFDLAALVPYYRRAQSVCRLGPYDYAPDAWATPRRPRLALDEAQITTKLFQVGPSPHFGLLYHQRIAAAANVRTLCYANAMELCTDANGGHVTHLNAATLNGRSFSVSAKLFILAAGGIANAHLLLISNRRQPEGLANAHGLVGRFFTEHPYVNAATFVPADGSVRPGLYWLQPAQRDGFDVGIYGSFSLSQKLQQRERIVNCVFRFLEPYADHPAFAASGVASLDYLRKALRQGRLSYEWPKHVGRVMRDLDDVAATMWRKKQASRYDGTKGLTVRSFLESAPNPDSRVTLSDQRDRLGRPQVKLDWRLSELDRPSFIRAHELLDVELRRAGVGRLILHKDLTNDPWPASMTGGHHHMGTTRMSTDPRQGVVNDHGRAHTLDNLYLTGSSTFPTAGSANPTLTIVALAIRLADHVKRVLTRSASVPTAP